MLFEKRNAVATITICLYLNSSVLLSICFFAGPNSIPRTLLAKFREQRVSVRSFSLGLICTNIKVLESPPAIQVVRNYSTYKIIYHANRDVKVPKKDARMNFSSYLKSLGASG